MYNLENLIFLCHHGDIVQEYSIGKGFFSIRVNKYTDIWRLDEIEDKMGDIV